MGKDLTRTGFHIHIGLVPRTVGQRILLPVLGGRPLEDLPREECTGSCLRGGSREGEDRQHTA